MKQIIFKDMNYFILEDEIFNLVTDLLNHLSDLKDESFEVLISTEEERKKFTELNEYLQEHMPDFRLERNSKDSNYNNNQEAILIKVK